MTAEKDRVKGIVLLILGAFMFSLFGIFNRLIAEDLGPFYQAFLRVTFLSTTFFLIGVVNKSFIKIKVANWPLFIFRSLLTTLDFACFFIAVTQLPLGLVLFAFYASNVITNYSYGSLILKEKITKIKLVSLLLALLGLLILYYGNLADIKTFPFLAAIFSGACFGITYASSKNLTDKYSVIQVNFVNYFIMILLIPPLIFLNREVVGFNLPIITWVWLGLFVLVNLGASYLTIYGYKLIEAQKASLIMLSELIFTVIVGFIFYLEIPTINTVIGGILIIIALALPNINFSFEK